MRLENILKSDEVLLSHIQTYDVPDTDDEQLCLNFRNLGDVYVPHLHTYSSVPLSNNIKKELIEIINQEKIGKHDNPFYPYRDSLKLVDHQFNILQIKAPRRVSTEFQKLKYNSRKEKFEYTKKKGRKKLFKSGHFDEQARWNVGYHDKDKNENDLNYEHCLQPGTIYQTDKRFIDTLKKKKELEDLHFEIKKEVRKFKHKHPDRKFRGDIVAKLRELFLEYENIEDARKEYLNWSEYKCWKGLNKTDVGKLTQLLVEKEKQFQNEIKGYGEIRYYTPDDHDLNKYRLFLNKRSNFKKRRQLTLDEWMSMKYVMIDIETPKFLERNDEITQVSACLVEDGVIKRKLLFNKEYYQLGVDENGFYKKINDHEVYSGYRTQEELVDAITDWIAGENVDVLMAYNNAFDFDKLKKAGLKVNKAAQATKQNVTLPFFKRFFLGDGFCMDLLNISRTLLSGFPNAKLEMFSRFLFGDMGYHKKITYREMYELQKLSEGCTPDDKEFTLKPSTIRKMEKHAGKRIEDIMIDFNGRRQLASEMILEYVSEDTDTMYNAFFKHSLVRKCLTHVKKAAEIFDLNFINLIHSPNHMKTVYDRGYFKHVGINRSEIYLESLPQFKKIIDSNKKSFATYINEIFNVENKNGTYYGVERRFIPAHILLKEAGLYTSKKVDKFLEYVNGLFDSEQCCPNELIFASRYVGGLLTYLQADLGGYFRKKDGFDSVIESLDDYFSPLFGRNKFEYRDSAREILNLICDVGLTPSEDEDGKTIEPEKVRSMQIRDFVKKLKNIPKFKEFVNSVGENNFIDSLKKEGLDIFDLHNIFHSYFDLKKQHNKIQGHYRIDAVKLKHLLDNGLNIEKDKLAIGKEILFMDYPFMITRDVDNSNRFDDENYAALFPQRVEESSIRVPIQTPLDKVFISRDKCYTKEHGFYKGITVKQEPDYKTNPFVSDFQRRALDFFHNRDFVNGTKIILECLEQIQKKIDCGPEPEDEKLQFLNFNKKRQVFIGFQNGERYHFTPKVNQELKRDKYRSFFYDGKIKVKGKYKNKVVYIQRDKDTGLSYYVLTSKAKNSKGEHRKTRVNIHGVNKYEPDYRCVLEYCKNKFRHFAEAAKEELIAQKKFELARELEKALVSHTVKKKVEGQVEFDFS